METAKQVLESDLKYIYKSLIKELESLSGKKILLTGGGGFLGYELSHVFSDAHNNMGIKPIQLTIYDNLSRGKKDWLAALERKNNVSLVKHDINNPIPKDSPKFDYIIHAASIASPIYYRKYPIETIDANVNGLRNLLEYTRQREESIPIKGMLSFSTSEIYGDPTPDAIPTSEDYRGFVSCTGPRACYDESKRLGETLCVNFFEQYNTPVKIVRPFNNYGPGLSIHDRRVLPDFARDIINNKDLILLSDGKATRTFCYVADAVCGYIKTLINGKSGQSYNIGTSSPEISIFELAEIMLITGKQLFNYKGKIIFNKSKDSNYLIDNPNRRCPNITKAITDLNYNPQINIDEGIKRSLLWYKENRK